MAESAIPEISEVSCYVLNGTGKKIRPALFFLSAYRYPGGLEKLVDAAVALEMIHTASLLHDDVIDHAAERRGKDSAHIKWNNRVSILTGDYLLSQALKTIVDYRNWHLMDVVVNVVQNMSEGEVEQSFAGINASDLEKRYFQWIGKKSASFFAGCCRAGNLFVGGDSREQERWSDFGFHLGIAFQLIDDMLDYTGKKELTGKPPYSDLKNRVVTLPLIRAMNESGKGTLIQHLLDDQEDGEYCRHEIARTVLNSDGPGYTYTRAREYAEEALEIMKGFQQIDKEVKANLEKITMEVLNREK